MVFVEQRDVPTYTHLEESLLQKCGLISHFHSHVLTVYFIYTLQTELILNIYIVHLDGLKEYFYSTQQLKPSPGTRTTSTNQK